jgi:uncharacterized protein YcnI
MSTTRLRRTALALLATLVAVLTLGIGTASAHVTVSAPGAAPGGFGELTFRVPSESDTANTTSVRVQLPAATTPFAFVSVKPVPGWTAQVTKTQLATPLDVEGTTVTEAVSEVTWTADNGGLTPGQYQSFSISAGPLPEGVDSLSFPALQGYSDGTSVAWIDPSVEGQAEPEHPAPTLSLTAATTDAAPAATPAATPAESGTSGLTVTALVVGVLGLLAGVTGVALAVGARRRAAQPAAVRGDEREHETAGV